MSGWVDGEATMDTYVVSKSCGVQKVLAIKLDNGREIGKRLIPYQVECSPP